MYSMANVMVARDTAVTSFSVVCNNSLKDDTAMREVEH